jgi:multicomponent Na+:H+ antiporter subunit C
VNSLAVFAICGMLLIGVGTLGLLSHPQLLRCVIAFNVVGSGVFLAFGALSARMTTGTAAATNIVLESSAEVMTMGGADFVPQAMVITGIVVALAVTALAVTLITRLYDETGDDHLPGDTPDPRAGRD